MTLVVGIVAVVVAIVVIFTARHWYTDALKPVSVSTEVRIVTIETGSSPSQIADLLEKNKIIKSAKAFSAYVRNNNVADQLKAGTFELSPSWSVSEIVGVLVSGKEASTLFTIAPGLRLDQIRERLLKAGFSNEDIQNALNPKTYVNHPALVGKPETASLEGYIYPESFKITASTTADSIIKQSLDVLAQKLTPALIKKFSEQSLTTFEAITLASLIEKEVSGYDDRRKVAQVLLKRLNEDIPLGIDATYLYAAAVFGTEPFPSSTSPYNTRQFKGIPPGPISNVDISGLEAIANPSDTDYLFYVSGDDGTNYFSKTQEEHEANIAKYCTKACAPGYVPPMD